MNNNWLEYIYTHLHKQSYMWARQCCAYNDDDAKEVMQMVYLKLLEGKAKYNQKASVKTWFFSVIRFTALDYRKTLNSPINVAEIEEKIEEDNSDYYKEILSQLPPRQHQVLLLVFYHNLKLQEVSEILDIGIGSVRTHYDRGKKKLKMLITKDMVL